MEMYPLSFKYVGGGTLLPYSLITLVADTDFTDATPNARGRLIGRSGSFAYSFNGTLTTRDDDAPEGDRTSILTAVNGPAAVESGHVGKCGMAYDAPVWVRIKDDGTFPDELREPNADYTGWELGDAGIHSGLGMFGRGFLLMGPPDFNHNDGDDPRILAQQVRPDTPFEAVIYTPDATDTTITSTSLFRAVPMRRAGKGRYAVCERLGRVLAPSDLLSYTSPNIDCTHSKTGFVGFGSDTERFMRVELQWNGWYYQTNSGGMTTVEGDLEVDGDLFYIRSTVWTNVRVEVEVPCELALPAETYAYALYDSFLKKLKLYDFCCPAD